MKRALNRALLPRDLKDRRQRIRDGYQIVIMNDAMRKKPDAVSFLFP
jgi:hypothetical protein